MHDARDKSFEGDSHRTTKQAIDKERITDKECQTTIALNHLLKLLKK